MKDMLSGKICIVNSLLSTVSQLGSGYAALLWPNMLQSFEQPEAREVCLHMKLEDVAGYTESLQRSLASEFTRDASIQDLLRV
jgi:hypothetical protein